MKKQQNKLLTISLARTLRFNTFLDLQDLIGVIPIHILLKSSLTGKNLNKVRDMLKYELRVTSCQLRVGIVFSF